MERQTGVIIVAGGGGSRMGGARPKQFMLLGGMPILARTINNFAAALPGAEIVVVLPAEHTGFWHNLSARFEVAPHTVAEGGRERFHSVKNGLAALKRDPELIAVQDGVRPLGSHELIRRTVAAAAEHGTAIPVVEPVDSFRETDGEADFADHRPPPPAHRPDAAGIPRRGCCAAPTKRNTAPEFTDDASVVEAVRGQRYFLRRRTGEPEDSRLPKISVIAEALLADREETANENGCEKIL